MSTISAAAVNELRKKTDLPLMECKKALTEASGDMDKAIELLRSWNAKASIKREGNETAEGRVAVSIDSAKAVAAIVEMRCESAPSAKADLFIALTADLAKHVAAHNPADVDALLAQPFGSGTVKTRIEEVVGLIREKMIVHKFTRLSGGAFGEYVHHDGMTGVLLHCNGTGGNAEALRDVSAHIAAMNPQYLSPAEIPAEAKEKEKALILLQVQEAEKLAEEKAIAEGKKYNPKNASIMEKVIEGKLKSWMAEICLTEQPMANTAKYPNTTVSQVLAKMGLTAAGYVRYKVGAVAA
jgi:elongation factor Ts